MKNNKQYASYILRALRETELPDDLYNEIIAWLANPDSKDEVNTALKEYWDELGFSESKLTYQAMADMRSELGMRKVKNNTSEPMTDSDMLYTIMSDVTKNKGALHYKRPKQRFMIWVGRIAAVLLPLLVVGGVMLWYSQQDKAIAPEFETMIAKTDADTQQNLILPDGTQVIMNGSSTVEYIAERKVRFSGEALFKVFRDTERPFYIEAGGLDIKVTGTEFNISAYPDSTETEVNLFNGSVEVSAGRNKELMTPGTYCRYDRYENKLVKGQSSEQKPEWILHKLKIDNKTISEIFNVLGWYYNVEFDIDGDLDNSLFKFELTGDESLPSALSMLQSVSGSFYFEIDDNKVEIKANQQSATDKLN